MANANVNRELADIAAGLHRWVEFATSEGALEAQFDGNGPEPLLAALLRLIERLDAVVAARPARRTGDRHA
jgi:hypothetical protein